MAAPDAAIHVLCVNMRITSAYDEPNRVRGAA